MKISALQENLSQGLSVVSHLASKNTSLPILNNIHLEAKDGSIIMSSTNLEIGIRSSIRGKVDEPGTLTLPARTFADFINLVPSGKIELTQEGDSLKIETAGSKTSIRGQSAEEFPLIPTVDEVPPIKLSAQEFHEAISQVVFAVAQDESRPEISGVFVVIEKENIKLVATDSYRLAERVLKIEGQVKEPQKVIIPARTVQELTRILSDDEAGVAMRVNDNQIMFSFGGVDLVSRLIEGQYPDYKQIIPTTHKTEVVVGVEPLMKAVKTAGLFSKSGVNDISLKASKGGLRVSAVNAQLGEYESNVKATVSGDDVETVYNYRYFLDGLANIGSNDATLAFVDAKSPGVLRPKNEDAYTYIVMPITQ